MHIKNTFKKKKATFYTLSDGRVLSTVELMVVLDFSVDTFYKRKAKLGLCSPKMFYPKGGEKAAHCHRGHLRSADNLTANGSCKQCNRERSAERARRMRKIKTSAVVIPITPKQFNRTETCWRDHIECAKYAECFEVMLEAAMAEKKFNKPAGDCWQKPARPGSIHAIDTTKGSYGFGFSGFS